MAASPIVAAPRSFVFGSRNLKYRPLSYAKRGQLEEIYRPAFKTPLDRYEEMIAKYQADPSWLEVPEETRKYVEVDGRAQARLNSLGAEPHLESPDAKTYFLEENLAGFLSVVFGDEAKVDYEAVAQALTKGESEDMYDYCLEIGAYVPKSAFRAEESR